LKIDAEDLRRYYASLSDEALAALDRRELTEVAQKYYDEEFARRELAHDETGDDFLDDADEDGGDDDAVTLAFEAGVEPDWLEDAACACTFADYPGSSSAAEAVNTRDVLLAAGIPCHIAFHKLDPPKAEPRPESEYRVMVPGALNLRASSVLDQMGNPELEEMWRTHFEALSDTELRALSTESLCAGLLDRAKRLKRAYEGEVARRKAKA